MKPHRGNPHGAKGHPRSPLAAHSAKSRKLGMRSWVILLVTVAGTVLAALGIRSVLLSRETSSRTLAFPVAPSAGGTSSKPGAANAAADADRALVEEINRANQLLAQGNSAEAVSILRAAAKKTPGDEDVFYNLGIALAREGKNEEAVEAYEEAVRIFPDYAEVHNNLGNLLLRMGKREAAIEHFEQAVKINPEYAAAWNNYGNLLQQLGRTNEAQEHFLRAVKFDTNYWQARYNLATSFLQQRRFEEARAEFEAVLRLEPDFPPAKQALDRIESEAIPGPVRP